MSLSSVLVSLVLPPRFLSIRLGVERVIVCDPLPPLSLTSDKSTECYRNLWPNRPMVAMTDRSIDLIEEMARESGNAFGLNRRGYVYITADRECLDALQVGAERSSVFWVWPGAGPRVAMPTTPPMSPLTPRDGREPRRNRSDR